MNIEIIDTIGQIELYYSAIQKNPTEKQALWDQFMIQPYWARLAQWAPGDTEFMKPKTIEDIDALSKQIELLRKIDLNELQRQFAKITKIFPKNDDESLLVAIYPLDNKNKKVKEQQNGVLGTCVFGNILLNVNPLAQDYEKWIPYVFAHEYHHSVWGNHWYVEKAGGGLEGNLLENLIIEGQADAFAMSLFPDLQPKWIQNFSQSENEVWLQRFQPMFNNKDREEMQRYIFGDENLDLPWCIGYSMGKLIVDSYLKRHSGMKISDLLEISPRTIYLDSCLDNLKD